MHSFLHSNGNQMVCKVIGAGLNVLNLEIFEKMREGEELDSMLQMLENSFDPWSEAKQA